MTYSAEQLSLAGDKYLGRSYSEMDCQAFVERCMRDVGYKRDLAGSNAWYRVMDWTGTPEQCVKEFGQVPKGALLFILKQDGKEPEKYKKDGIGNASHIGIKTGRGDGAINSSSSRGCVCTSKFKDKSINGGWNRVGLLKVFAYGTSVDWILNHSGQGEPEKPGKGGEPMQGKVVAPSGATVNLRHAPAINSPLVDRIPVGSEVEIIGQDGEWFKVVACGLVGWMKKEFVKEGYEEPPGDDFGPGDLDPKQVTITLDAETASTVYPTLKAICDQIMAQVGRG